MVAAYGIALHAILYPNSKSELKLVPAILQKAYFQMYGELYLDELEGTFTCTDNPVLYHNGTLPRCPQKESQWLSPIFLGVYILITNILMFNLLIAMFSYTFQKVQIKTNEVWNFQRLNFICEYSQKPLLPPPFILLAHMYLIARRICGRCCPHTPRSPFCKNIYISID